MNTMADRLIEAMMNSAADEDLVLASLVHDVGRYAVAQEEISDTLSKGSKHTLVLQGGAMTAGEIVSAGMQPWWPDALRLRRWDDQAKVVGKPTRDLASWEPLLRKYFSAPRAGR